MRGAKKAAFDGFEQGLKPSQLNIRGVKRTTLYRYHQAWKRLKGSPPSPPGDNISSTGQGPHPEEASIKNCYEEFMRLQEVNIKKEEVREMIEALAGGLVEADEEYLRQGIQIDGWQRRHQLYMGRLEFLVQQLDAAQSEGAIAGFEGLLGKIEGEIVALAQELRQKVNDREQLRRTLELERSCELLRENPDLPLFPSYVKRAVERRPLVRNQGEAEEVFQTLCQWEVVHDAASAQPARKKQLWNAFLRGLDQERWDFIRRLKRDNGRLKRQIQGMPYGPPLLPVPLPGLPARPFGIAPWLPY